MPLKYPCRCTAVWFSNRNCANKLFPPPLLCYNDKRNERVSSVKVLYQFIVSQTNPWVVPFLPSSDETVTDMPWNFRGIVCRVWHLFGANLRHVVFYRQAQVLQQRPRAKTRKLQDLRAANGTR